MNCVQTQGGRLDRESGKRTRIHSLLRGRFGDRGATLVEYALGVSLIVVASIGSLQFLEDGASDELADRSGRGAPDLEEGTTDGGTTDGTTSDGTDTTDGGPAPTEVFFEAFENQSTTIKKEKGVDKSWTATLDVQINDGSTSRVSGAQVVGRWTYVQAGQTIIVDATCDQTDNQGECRFQLSEIALGVSDVTFEMIDITGGVPPVEYNGATQSTTLTKPPSA